ncbi:MAG: hypothetical protein RR636_06730 [Clostridium sp.]|uniref:hypothetical protein n=1 Tax=Clostridium sp. TaxID=1506 RepID=UPI0030667206
MKKNFFQSKTFGALGGLFGIWLSRTVYSKYGDDGRLMLMYLGLLVFLGIILYGIYIKNYKSSIIMCLLSIPIIIGAIGIYMDNFICAMVGLILLFVVLKISTMYVKDNK